MSKRAEAYFWHKTGFIGPYLPYETLSQGHPKTGKDVMFFKESDLRRMLRDYLARSGSPIPNDLLQDERDDSPDKPARSLKRWEPESAE